MPQFFVKIMLLFNKVFYPLALFIGLRYSRAKGSNGFVSFISLFSIGGIALGVMALIVVSSVMNGFEQELKERILGLMPHAVISQESALIDDWQQLQHSLNLPDFVHSASPYISSEAMVQSATDLRGVMLQGLYPKLIPDAAHIEEQMLSGTLASLEAGEYKIILGQGIANALNVYEGDKLRLLVTENPRYTPMGRMPRTRLFTVAGMFRFGSDVDDRVIMIHGDDAKRLLNKQGQGVAALRLYLNDPFQVKELELKLTDDLHLQDWRREYGQLFHAVQMEKNMMSLLLALIIAVAAFNILSALVMLVSEKENEVAILKTLGLRKPSILAIFMVQGAWSGVLGTVLGCISGILVTHYINELLSFVGLNLIAAAAGGGRSLPIAIDSQQVLVIILATTLLSLVSTLYPALRAAKVSPAEILSYE